MDEHPLSKLALAASQIARVAISVSQCPACGELGDQLLEYQSAIATLRYSEEVQDLYNEIHSIVSRMFLCPDCGPHAESLLDVEEDLSLQLTEWPSVQEEPKISSRPLSTMIREVSSRVSTRFPQPIAQTFVDYRGEQSSQFRRVHRLKDTFEITMKYLAISAIAISLQHGEWTRHLSNKQVRKLNRFSAGEWWNVIESIVSVCSTTDPTFRAISELRQSEVLSRTVERLKDLRDTLAHSGTPPPEDCRSLIERYEPDLLYFLDKCQFITRRPLMAITDIDFDYADLSLRYTARPYMGLQTRKSLSLSSPLRIPIGSMVIQDADSGELVSLHPLLRHEKEQQENEKDKERVKEVVFYDMQTRTKRGAKYINYRTSKEYSSPSLALAVKELLSRLRETP